MAIRALLLTCLQILTCYNYNVLGTKTIDIHMSNNDSIDEETKRILSEVDSDDSVESKLKKEIIELKKGKNWETNTLESPDEEW